jgi:ketosteroid isomerase-like protein
MPPYSQSAVGKERVRKAYDAVFAELKFDVKFAVAELVLMAPDWAYVRTNSAGVTGHASTAEANQELFIFKKGEDGKCRIARYSFSPTNPPSV